MTETEKLAVCVEALKSALIWLTAIHAEEPADFYNPRLRKAILKVAGALRQAQSEP